MQSPARARTRLTPDALVVFCVALALRLAHLLWLRASPFLELRLGDAATYDKWARTIAGGDWLGSEVFFQAPLYPYWLGTVYATLGDAPLVVRGLQAGLSAAACALLASATARLVSRGAGLAAGLLLATYAPSIFLDGLLQKCVLDVFFLCLALWLAARLLEGPRPALAGALGLAMGALALARENALILAGVFGLWLLSLPALPRARRLLLAGVFAGGVAAALAPVALRNAWVGGELHLTTSQFGLNFWIGNHAGATGLYQSFEGNVGVESERQDARARAERALGRPLSAGEVSDYWLGRALDDVRADPGAWLGLMGRKALLLVSAVELMDAEDQYRVASYSPPLRLAGVLGHFGVLAPLSVLGLFVLWPRRRELWWIAGAVAAYSASVLIFYVVARYRYPLAPFLALLAGTGLAGARSWLRSSGPVPRVACGLLVVGTAALSNAVAGMPKHKMAAITELNVAQGLRTQGHAERAERHYREALALDPDLGEAAEALGGAEGALDAYQRQLAAHPDDPRLHRHVAEILREAGDREQAVAHYRRALELAPGDAAARRGLAELETAEAAARLRRGDAAGALAHYREALTLAPRSLAALNGAAWILATQDAAELRDPEQALALAERAAAQETPPGADTLETLAAAHAAAGQWEPALARAHEAEGALRDAGRPVPPRLARAIAAYERGEALRLRLGGNRGAGP